MVPDLSIVVPVRDEAANVGPLVEALLVAVAMLGLRAELLVIDDGSKDGTSEALDIIAARTPQLRIVHLVVGGGQSAALLVALARAAMQPEPPPIRGSS